MAALRRILFVDDEVNVLDGLRVLLRKHRRVWDMEFANGGDQALALLSAQGYDVVVTDLRMPRVDGLTLLKHLRDHHPYTMRIVLSGAPEKSSALAVIPYAHQSLSKPCRLGELEAVLERAFLLGELVADPDVRSVVGRVGELPPLPRTYSQLVKVLDDENSGTADVAAVISSDIAVTAKILQLANSAFFGGGRPVSTVMQAIGMLGIEALKSLTLSTALFNGQGLSPRVRQFAETLHEHSALVASTASDLAPQNDKRDAFAAGMLHDVGRLVLASSMPEEMADQSRASLRVPSMVPKPSGQATALVPARHAKVGAYLLGLWGLPPTVIDAVARHHDPITPMTGPCAAAVMVAEFIVDEVCGDRRPTGTEIEKIRKLTAQYLADKAARAPQEKAL